MDRKAIIDGLKMTMELCVFDPSTGEEIEPHLLNDMNRATYDACKGALEILGRLDTDTDTISRKQAIDVLKELTANGTNKGMVFGEDAVHRIEMLPPAQPEIIDGRLFVTVDDIKKVNCVLVDERKSNFCRQFWMDGDGDGPAPCEDAVSREKINKFCHEVIKRDPDGDNDIVKAFEAFRAYVNSLPPVAQKQSTGKWIEDKGQQILMQKFIERGEVWRVCSVCGAGHMIGHKYASDKAYHNTYHNFCPNCGAKMKPKGRR